MKQKQPDKHIFTTRQLIGAVLFGCIMVTIIILAICLHQLKTQQTEKDSQLQILQERALVIESRLQQSRRYNNQYPPKEKVLLHLSPFDPNTADSLTLITKGIPHWMVRMMLNYRRRGGLYKSVEDMKKIPYISDSLYTRIAPYVCIDTTLFPQDTLPKYHFAQQWTQKKDTVLELNSCDTTSLKLLRGIGTYTAMQIISYRKQLGGYASVRQLREIKEIEPYITDSLLPHFTVCTDSIHPIPVNHSNVERLQRHPYLTFTQAKALYEHRRNNFRLYSIDALLQLEEFSEKDIQRLSPYLSFEE